MMNETSHQTDNNEAHHNQPQHQNAKETKPVSALGLGSALNRPNPNAGAGKSALHSALHTKSDEPKDPNETVRLKYLAYWVNKKEDEKLYTVPVELPHYESVGDAISDILPLLNKCLADSGSPYAISEDPAQYDLYKAKKNGHPKLDYPALDANQLLNQTGLQQIAIVEKDVKVITLRNNPEAPKEKEKSAPQPKQQPAKQQPAKDHMVDTSMPLDISIASMPTVEDEYQTETYCWCFTKVIKRKKVPQSISMQKGLSTGLLES